jgi:hypothetical protein
MGVMTDETSCIDMPGTVVGGVADRLWDLAVRARPASALAYGDSALAPATRQCLNAP